jgi:predicted ATPase
MGKTRLALQVAAELSDDFTDGVYFVNLAPISDLEFVIPTIAQTLGLREVAGQPLLEHLKGELQQKQLLLLLDNFEQVVSVALQLMDVLAACPRLKVLVTSREVLHVRAEHEFVVPPLALPDLTHLPELAVLSHYAAVALFLERARATKPDFQLTAANARVIAEICVRLDGLPLAIELAAARIKLFPPQALLARLDQRLHILTSRAQDAPARQQSLRNTIAWSYELQHAEEQRLFRRLSIFVGGCTLEAVEAVCRTLGDQAEQILDGVASLIDKSLLRQEEQEEGEVRFWMLQTIREYGLERLESEGELEATRQAHATYYLTLAEEAEPEVRGPQQVLWRARLNREQENLRAALQWFVERREAESALRLSGALWLYWYSRGQWGEALQWLKRALEVPPMGERTATRAKVLGAAGLLMLYLGKDVTTAQSLLEEAVAISQELGDKRGLALSLTFLEDVYRIHFHDYVTARRLLEQSFALAQEVEDKWVLAVVLNAVAEISMNQGDYVAARALFQETMALQHEVEDKWGLILFQEGDDKLVLTASTHQG